MQQITNKSCAVIFILSELPLPFLLYYLYITCIIHPDGVKIMHKIYTGLMATNFISELIAIREVLSFH